MKPVVIQIVPRGRTVEMRRAYPKAVLMEVDLDDSEPKVRKAFFKAIEQVNSVLPKDQRIKRRGHFKRGAVPNPSLRRTRILDSGLKRRRVVRAGKSAK